MGGEEVEGVYITAADAGPLGFDEDVVGGFERGDRAVFDGDFALRVQDEGWVLWCGGLGTSWPGVLERGMRGRWGMEG